MIQSPSLHRWAGLTHIVILFTYKTWEYNIEKKLKVFYIGQSNSEAKFLDLQAFFFYFYNLYPLMNRISWRWLDPAV